MYIHYILYSLVLILYLKCGGGLGGGGVMSFSYFTLFTTCYRKTKKLGNTTKNKKIEKNNYLSFNVFFMFFYAGNIEKCPFTYWLNGRWFLQIVDGDSWNLYPLYPLFPCSDFVSQMWGVFFFGGGGVRERPFDFQGGGGGFFGQAGIFFFTCFQRQTFFSAP